MEIIWSLTSFLMQIIMDSSSLEAYWDSSLDQGGVEDVFEDMSQLISNFLAHLSCCVIGTRRLPCVNSFQGPSDISCVPAHQDDEYFSLQECCCLF